MTKILIIDDEEQLRSLLARIISLEGYDVVQANSIKSGLKQIEQQNPNLVLCDVFLPDGNGVDAIRDLKKALPDGEIIMLTAHGNIADGVRAIKNGAYDYLTKGDDNNRIIPMIANAMEKVSFKTHGSKLERIIKKEYTFESILGDSRTLQNAIQLARKVAPTDTAILLTGETGTGKEVFAKAIHTESTHRQGEFVAVNCAALSNELLESEMFGHKAGAFTGAIKDKKGLFEQADKGTIFLDEVGEMPLSLQAKLLRVLETGEFIAVGDTKTKRVNIRIIAATNRKLNDCITNGTFREDLFYRLSVFSIELPPLRERGEDVILLAQNFIAAFAMKMNKPIHQIEQPFWDALTRYGWQGNIRELRNTIERCIILSSNNKLQFTDLPLDIQVEQGCKTNRMELSSVEKAHIIKMLAHTNGNKTEAARLMKIGLTTLYRKMEEYGITSL